MCILFIPVQRHDQWHRASDAPPRVPPFQKSVLSLFRPWAWTLFFWVLRRNCILPYSNSTLRLHSAFGGSADAVTVMGHGHAAALLTDLFCVQFLLFTDCLSWRHLWHNFGLGRVGSTPGPRAPNLFLARRYWIWYRWIHNRRVIRCGKESWHWMLLYEVWLPTIDSHRLYIVQIYSFSSHLHV